MSATPVVPGADKGPKPTLTEMLEAKAGRMLGIPEDTPEPDAQQDTAPDEDQLEADVVEEQPEADDAVVETEEDADAQPEPELDDEPELHTIKVDGKEERVTIDEMKAGHMRHRDYTQKTQRLAERDKQLEQEIAGQRDARSQLIAVLEKAEVAVKALAPEQEPDWAALSQELPAEDVLKAQQEHREYKKRLKVIQDRIEAERQAQFADEQKSLEKLRETEAQRLIEVIPTWKDETKREAGQKAVVEYALGLGFTKEQLRMVSDHRLIVLLDKARRFDALRSGQPRGADKSRKGIRTATPGAATQPKPRSTKDTEAMDRARKNLQKSGSKRDLATLLELRL